MSSPDTAQTAEPAKARYGWIDHLKAWAILAVLFSHARYAPWDKSYGVWDLVLGVTWNQFHVPAFLFLSGFLYFSPEPTSLRTTWHRLRRVLVPYTIFSTAALLWFPAGQFGRQTALYALATGSAHPFYYYIFVHVLCMPFTLLLSRVSARGAIIVLLTVIAATIARYAVGCSFIDSSDYWSFRDPLARFWWGYFIAGWTAAAWWTPIRSYLTAHRRMTLILISAAFTFSLAVLLANNTPVLDRSPVRGLRPLTLTARIALTGAVVALAAGLDPRPRARGFIRLLSDSTLSIYLAHGFVLAAVAPWFHGVFPPLRILSLVGIMLGACIAFALLARLLFGQQRARTLFGA